MGILDLDRGRGMHTDSKYWQWLELHGHIISCGTLPHPAHLITITNQQEQDLHLSKCTYKELLNYVWGPHKLWLPRCTTHQSLTKYLNSWKWSGSFPQEVHPEIISLANSSIHRAGLNPGTWSISNPKQNQQADVIQWLHRFCKTSYNNGKKSSSQLKNNLMLFYKKQNIQLYLELDIAID